MDQVLRFGFVGNPNCGKTTLFNAFTGANLKVANWPGVTVERIEGETTYKGHTIKLIDLPGIYSLTSYSIEEKVSRKCIQDNEIDVIVNVIDASNLERNLYLTLQLLELKKPMVLALNMMDIVEERGIELDLHRLPEMLGNIPVIPVSARKRTGLEVLIHAAIHHYMDNEPPFGNVVPYTKGLKHKINKLITAFAAIYPEVENPRWYAIKLLESDEEITRQYPANFSAIVDYNYEETITNQKYDYIEHIVDECTFRHRHVAALTDKVDKYLTHNIWGIPIFLLIMATVFFLTFNVGDFLKGYFETFLSWFSDITITAMTTIHVADWLISLVVDGIIAGVGGILTFLPNIFILFLALAILEDSGYMSRVAYIMNEVMGKLGLSGKAFLPMLLGFGCTVPAVMATRALESEKDRRKTILITPFMSCSARLPIYVLFAQMFFGKYATLAAFLMYVSGAVIAILIAFVLEKISPSTANNALLIELPEYKSPNFRTIRIYVWDKIKDYLGRAGTVIFLASIILWFILNYGMHGAVTDISQSFGAVIGKWLVPVMIPAGLGLWQVVLALISGLASKEVVVASFSVLFGIANVNSADGMTLLAGNLSAYNFGPANALAIMVFCLLYTPCAASVGTIKNETGSWKWTGSMLAFQLTFAWMVTVIVYQIARMVL